MSRPKAFFTFILLLVLMLTAQARAQTAEAQRALAVYVDALKLADATRLAAATTADFYRQLAASKANYPVLASLGPVLKIDIAAVSEFPGAKIFRATIEHAGGKSIWQIRLSDDNRIAAAELSQVVEVAQPVGSGSAEIASTKNAKGAIFGEFKGGVFGSIFSDAMSMNADMLASKKGFARPTAAPPPTAPAAAPGPAAPTITTQQPCARDAGLCAGPLSDSDPRLVEFLFATDRKLTIASSTSILPIDTDRDGKLSYGAVAVHIPRDDQREIGQINLPSVWKLFGYTLRREKTDEDKHFVLKRIAPLSADEFRQIARGQGKSSALVFVHGFNTSFEEALYRNAQVVYDLGYKGLSVLYAWTSKRSVASYIYDRDSALIARSGFLELLATLRDDLNIETVNVIAHSMGNLVVMDAMTRSAGSAKPVRIDRLIMAAPDVPRDMFFNDMPAVMALTGGTTLYASSADKALKLSGSLASFPRAGDVPVTGPVILPKLDTIDVTAIGNEFLGLNHTEFAADRSVIEDIKRLIEEGLASPRLGQIRAAPEAPLVRTHWRFMK